MADDRSEPLLRVSAFEVLIGEREVGFAQVGPLTSASDLDRPSPPDRPDRRPTNRFAPVVLRRALSGSTELYEWRRRVAEGRDDRRDVTIRQLAAPGGKVVNAWRLVKAWPVRWSGPSLDAMHNEIAFEEIELAFDDLVWLDPGHR